MSPPSPDLPLRQMFVLLFMMACPLAGITHYSTLTRLLKRVR